MSEACFLHGSLSDEKDKEESGGGEIIFLNYKLFILIILIKPTYNSRPHRTALS